MHKVQESVCFGKTLRRYSFWTHARRTYTYALMHLISLGHTMLPSSTLLFWTYIYTWNNRLWPRKYHIIFFFYLEMHGLSYPHFDSSTVYRVKSRIKFKRVFAHSCFIVIASGEDKILWLHVFTRILSHTYVPRKYLHQTCAARA